MDNDNKEVNKQDMEEILKLKKAFEDDPNHPISLLINGYLGLKMGKGPNELVKTIKLSGN